MNFTPKNDASFQKALQEMLKGLVPVTPTVLEVPKKSSLWTSAEDFTDLRIQFFWTHCFPEDYAEEEPELAFQAYRAVRDTLEAQVFVEKNPLYFSKIHDALCRSAVSVKEARRTKKEQAT